MRGTRGGLLAGFLLAAALAGCQSASTQPGVDPDLVTNPATDPNALYLEGTVVALRPNSNTLIIRARGATAANTVSVKYDLHSRLLIDGRPATLVDVHQDMPVKIKAHMVYLQGTNTDGACLIDVAKFSSTLINTTPPPATRR